MQVSIITASYNYEEYIKETIESVLAQTYKDWELIIVDDGSSDNSVNIIKEYCAKDSRIKLFQHENAANKGLKETILLGIENAQNDWIAFLESDDIFTPDYLEKKIELIKQYPDIKFIFNDVNLFGDKDRIKEYDRYYDSVYKVLRSKTYPCNIFYEFDQCNMVSTFSAVMLKKDVLKNINFDTPVKRTLDYWLWIQVAKNNDFYYLDEKLTNWRLHKNSYISNNRSLWEITWQCLNFDIEKKKLLYEGLKLKFQLLTLIPQYLKCIRRNIIRVSFKEKWFSLFGKVYHLK